MDIDAYLHQIILALQKVVEQTVSWRKPSPKARSFWNSDCAKFTKTAKRLRCKYESSRSTNTWEDYQQAQLIKAKAIQRAKTLYFRECVHEAAISKKRVWRLVKWAKNHSQSPRNLPKLPAIRKDKEATTTATDFESKVQILKDRFFSLPPVADLEDIGTAQYPIPLQLPELITPEEVQAAIHRPNPDKAPGINGLPNHFLRHVLDTFLPHFTHLFQACINFGYHPKEF